MEVNVRRLASVIKNYRHIVFGSFLVIVVLMYFAGRMYLFTAYPFLYYPSFFASLYIVYLCFRQYRITRLKMIESLLTEQCDPERYTDVLGEFLGRLQDLKINTDVGIYEIRLGFEMYWLWFAEGIIASGKYDEALDILQDLAAVNPEKDETLYKLLYQHDLCSVYLSLGDAGKASRHFGQFEGIFNTLNQRGKRAWETRRGCLLCRLDIAKGVYDGAEIVFTDAYDSAETSFDCVNAMYFLGQVYQHNGDTVRAKEAFEYVIEHGSKLYIAEESKERLALPVFH
jgi:tetratricopeptide (TPR) repeat protein